MPVSVDFTPPLDVINAINEAIANTNLMNVAYTRNTRRLLQRWIAALRVEPAGAQNFYPIHWKTAKQRKAFFASNGFGGGIPSTRTHALSRGWQGSVDGAGDGGTFTVFNDAPEGDFVYGSFDSPRQPMFDGSTGGIPWGDPFEISAPFFDEAEEILISSWFTITDEWAGVYR